MSDIDASIMFPSDAVKPGPDMNRMAFAREDAAMRLMRRADPAVADPADDAEPTPSQTDDVAKLLFSDDATPDYAELIDGELADRYRTASADGDTEHADAIEHAQIALAADFRDAGTDPDAIKIVFSEVRQSAMMTDMTHEQAEKSYADGLAAVAAAGYSEAELQGARQLVADLDRVSPGVIDSLSRFGAGNSPKVIAAAVREAKRRGYVR